MEAIAHQPTSLDQLAEAAAAEGELSSSHDDGNHRPSEKALDCGSDELPDHDKEVQLPDHALGHNTIDRAPSRFLDKTPDKSLSSENSENANNESTANTSITEKSHLDVESPKDQEFDNASNNSVITSNTEPHLNDIFGEMLVKCYGHPNFKLLGMEEKTKAYAIKDIAGLHVLYAYLETHSEPGGEEFNQLIRGLVGDNIFTEANNSHGEKDSGSPNGKPENESSNPESSCNQLLRRVLGMQLEAPFLPSHSAKFVRSVNYYLKVEDTEIWPRKIDAQDASAAVIKDAVTRIPDVRTIRLESADRFHYETTQGKFSEMNWNDFVDHAVRLSGLPNANYHPWEAIRFHGAWKGFSQMTRLIQTLLDEMLPGKTLKDVDNDLLFQNLIRLCIPDVIWMECLKISEFKSITEFLKVLDKLKTDTRFAPHVLRLTFGIPQANMADYSGIGIRPIHPILDSFPSEGPVINHMRLMLPDFYPTGVPSKLNQHLPPVCNETRLERNCYRMASQPILKKSDNSPTGVKRARTGRALKKRKN